MDLLHNPKNQAIFHLYKVTLLSFLWINHTFNCIVLFFTKLNPPLPKMLLSLSKTSLSLLFSFVFFQFGCFASIIFASLIVVNITHKSQVINWIIKLINNMVYGLIHLCVELFNGKFISFLHSINSCGSGWNRYQLWINSQSNRIKQEDEFIQSKKEFL